MKPIEKQITENIMAQLVVIGSGGSGMAAALTALERGLKDVVVIEKRFVTGGNASLAGGFIFAAETKIQREAGIDMSRDSVFKETMSFHHYDRINPRIIRAFIDGSADSIQWLVGKGVEIEWNGDSHILKNLSNPVGGFGRVMKLLAREFTDRGGRIMVNTNAKEIIRNEKGKVSAVQAENKEGKIISKWSVFKGFD